MNSLTWGGGAAAVVVVAGIAWTLTRNRSGDSINDPVSAAQAAEASLAAFDAHGAVIGDDGGAALVVARDGRMAVVKRHGTRLAVREVGPRMLVATPAGVEVQGGGRRFRKVLLVGVDALDVRKLVPAG